MPLVISILQDGKRNVIIILGPDNVDRIKEKDPVEVTISDFPWKEPIGLLRISYASDAELIQLEQLARQGKIAEVIERTAAGWRYRPEMGDHDGPPTILNR